MNTCWMKLFAAMFALSVTTAAAQQPAAATDVAGTWTLDTHLSDNPEQVAASIRIDLGPAQPMPDAPPENGRFGRGSGRRGQAAPAQPSPQETADRRALDDTLSLVRYPPPTLQIARTATAVTLTDQHGAARTFQTNGKREQQVFESARADTTARWEGPQLVIDFDLGKGRTMTYTYSIVPTTRQLMLRIAFERAPGDRGPFEVRYVYNRAS